MENFKTIVYTELDGQVLMIVPENKEIQIIPRPLVEMIEANKTVFLQLRDFCIAKLGGELKYVLADRGAGILNIQPVDGENLSVVISELTAEEITLITQVSAICTAFLN